MWLLACSSSGCAVLMLGAGHEGGSASLSDALAQSDSSKKVRPLDVGYTTPPVVGVEAEEAPPEPPPAPAVTQAAPDSGEAIAETFGPDSGAAAPPPDTSLAAPPPPKRESRQQPLLIGLVG